MEAKGWNKLICNFFCRVASPGGNPWPLSLVPVLPLNPLWPAWAQLLGFSGRKRRLQHTWSGLQRNTREVTDFLRADAGRLVETTFPMPFTKKLFPPSLLKPLHRPGMEEVREKREREASPCPG